MPFLTIEVPAGVPKERRGDFAGRVTATASELLATEEPKVRIRFDELDGVQVFQGGTLVGGTALKWDKGARGMGKGPHRASVLYRVELTRGRTVDQKSAFASALARAGEECLDTDASAIRIIFRDLDWDEFAPGGVLPLSSSVHGSDHAVDSRG